jgi:hypothetical protein
MLNEYDNHLQHPLFDVLDRGVQRIMRPKPFVDFGPTPGALLRTFLDELGSVSPQMSLIDSAFSHVCQQMAESKNPKKFIRTVASTQGNSDLYTDHIDFDSVHQTLYLSHIAFISSAMEAFCECIEEHPVMNAELRSTAQGGYLQRAVYVMCNSRTPLAKPVDPGDQQMADFAGDPDCRIVDYFRRIRNKSLHVSSRKAAGKCNLSEDRLKSLPIDRIVATYGHAPSSIGEINRRDVRLFSLACQKVANNLCRGLFTISKERVISDVEKRFMNKPDPRRTNGIRSILRQEFLLTENEVEEIFIDNGW